MRLAETIGRWLGRVEVVIAGVDDALREGEAALSRGDPMAARAEARQILAHVPGSPVGLALLADACEMAQLDAELALTLEELAARVASRADVWVRLGRARQATGAPLGEVRDAFVRALAVAESGSEARREALLALADLDLAQKDGARAELWLERAASDKSADVALRRAEARLAQGDAAGARSWLERFTESATDARAAIARGRALAMSGDSAAFGPLARAMMLDAPGASELLSSALAGLPADDTTRARVHLIVAAKGEAELARWRAAFARADGRREEARVALKDALSGGDLPAARPLLDAALEDRDYASLSLALAALPPEARAGTTARDALRVPSPEALADPHRAVEILDALGEVTSDRVSAWAEALRTKVAEGWVPASGSPARWSDLLARLDAHARALHDLDAAAALASVSVERTRPVRVAIVGEFNAGKSTFINALMGADIAPTGVLPTTATLHHLRYAPDPIARILLAPAAHDGPSAPLERIVPVGDLRATLKSTPPASVRRVEILLPIASLTRVEILDTPGFNAPDAHHAEAARAAFVEADFAIWLLDAGQAFKQTEREVLEEARRAKLPVQVLVNKADRLTPNDLAKVMAMVDASLAELGLASFCAPVALSARLALAGRLGDAAALAASGWDRVQELLESQIVARSEELKERALRRRAAVVVKDLLVRGARAAEEERGESEALEVRARAAAHAAASLDRDLDGVVTALAKGLGPAMEAWRHDLEIVVTGRDADAAARDPVLARYRVERALARLAPPLAEALAARAGVPELPSAELASTVRAAVRAFAASGDGASVAPLVRAAASTLVEQLGALAVTSTDSTRASGRVRELEALARALS